MNYGMLASNSCMLTDIVDQLQEPSKKLNSILSPFRHLSKSTPKDALNAYLTYIKKWCPAHPVIHIYNSDVVKPDGHKFESLGWVRDRSESTSTKNGSIIKKNPQAPTHYNQTLGGNNNS